MNFKITPLFTQKDIQKDIEKHMDAFHRIMLSEISAVGLKFVTDARNIITYDDQTGNLRSSIGYIIVYNGQVVKEDFSQSGGPIGQQEGRQYAEYVGSLHNTGYALITVAGMEYASFVEAKDFDVITGSTSNANTAMRGVWNNVKRALKK